MKKMMIIVAMAAMMLMPIGAEAHEVYGTITFNDVIDEIESWDIDEKYEEHLISSKTEIDYENESYDQEFWFDEDCEYEYATICVQTRVFEGGKYKYQTVQVSAIKKGGIIERAAWDFDEFAEEFSVWGEE